MSRARRKTKSSMPPPSPSRLLWATGVAIFSAEAMIMAVLAFFPALPEFTAAIVDATVLLGVTLPVLYLTWVRSLRRSLSDHARAKVAAELRSRRDVLTQLPNRLAFESAAERELELARSRKSAFTLVVLDIRRFHEINLALGHKTGDSLLCQIAQRLTSGLPRAELVTRLGPDVFGVLLPGVSLDRAGEAAHRIHQIIEEPFDVSEAPIEIEGHCGVVVYPDHGEDAALLLQRAEVALRAAKNNGERTTLFSHPDEAITPRRLKLFGLLRAAMQQGELSPTYQAKVELATGRIVGAEALLVWKSAELGLVPTSEFIGLAERTSLIKPLTAWVCGKVIGQLASWKREGLHLHVSVNLSTRNLCDTTLPAHLRKLLAEADVASEQFVAEITESAVLAEPERTSAVIDALCAMGIRLSLDDFGTGYSSLTYLRTLPAKELKIDRSFVRDLDRNSENAAIIRGIIDLAHDLGLVVVAEGVENADVMERLREFGCDLVQGYYVSRPMPAEQFAALLRDSRGVLMHVRRRPSQLPTPLLPQLSLPSMNSRRPALRESLRSLRVVYTNIHSEAPPSV